jgi:amino acid permease
VFALTNGGTAGMIWGYLIVWAGYMLVFASIAEMASMYVNEVASSICPRFADNLRQGSNVGRSISLGV